MTYDLSGDGKTVLKANYGKYYWNPGADFVFNIQPNASAWWSRYRWTDLNNNNRWEPGELGAFVDRRGGAGTETLDPDLKDSYTNEFAGFIEREVMANFGVRAGYVYRGQRDQYARVNINRPFAAFTVPVTITDPGPDNVASTTADNGPSITAYDLAQEFRGRPVVNRQMNVESPADYHTFEITGTKRMSNRWSLLASYGWTKSFDQAATIQGNSVRGNALPQSPNDLINANDKGQLIYSRSTVKLNGTWNSPFWDITISPLIRYQQGVPFGRTFQSSLSFGSVRFLAEPMGTRRQDAIFISDLRVEKTARFGGGRDISVFFDLYNMFNANPAQNLQWSSGTAFNRPLSIVPPRLARFGAKVNF
jgi:hypothetical protein